MRSVFPSGVFHARECLIKCFLAVYSRCAPSALIQRNKKPKEKVWKWQLGMLDRPVSPGSTKIRKNPLLVDHRTKKKR